MWRSRGQRLLKRLHLRESWVIFFVLGNVMLNFPFLKIFNQPTTIFGFPVMYLYLTIGWAISIGVIYLFVTSVEHEVGDQRAEEQAPQ
jgi:hypothetical protein